MPNSKHGSIIKRELLTIGSAEQTSSTKTVRSRSVQEFHHHVLIVNSSHVMAREITVQLIHHLPASGVMFAPTLEMARHFLSRKHYDLIIASPVLPDGGIEKLRNFMLALSNPPDLLVVNDPNKAHRRPYLQRAQRENARLNSDQIKLHLPSPTSSPRPVVQQPLNRLGADIRNDLNNPLQEIVAMVFVAKAGKSLSEPTQQALEAIASSAKGMAEYVNSLEDKIKKAVGQTQ